ncbi:MAG: TIGR04282 family arsenosugar biosynthesis glycosyltransferase [Nocardioidaceae bacterium]
MTTTGQTAGLTLLVLAKTPVPGRVKTRLAADLRGGHDAAAIVAAAALLDTIDACVAAVGATSCRLALEGDLRGAVRGAEIRDALSGWTVVPQRGTGLGERLARAHADVTGPVLQVGMDTPQLTADLLHRTAAGLASSDAVLAPAADGGWWALALRAGRDAAVLRDVEMSTPHTYRDTRTALLGAGLNVGVGEVLTDVDRLEDLVAVAEQAPWSRCALTAPWEAVA